MLKMISARRVICGVISGGALLCFSFAATQTLAQAPARPTLDKTKPVVDKAKAAVEKAKPAPEPAKPAVAPAATKPAPAATKAAPSVAKPAAKPATKLSPEDEAKKTEILHGEVWRRTMIEFNEWLGVQPFYDQKQVQQIQARLARRVKEMSVAELQALQADLQAKLQVIDSQQAKEARAWLSQYLSVMSDRKRDEVLKDMPNLATMSVAELSAEIQRIEQRRAQIERSQAAFRQAQGAAVKNTLQADRAAQQASLRAQQTPPTQSYSPYRSALPPGTKAYDDVQIGPNLDYYFGPLGGVGVMFNPSSF